MLDEVQSKHSALQPLGLQHQQESNKYYCIVSISHRGRQYLAAAGEAADAAGSAERRAG